MIGINLLPLPVRLARARRRRMRRWAVLVLAAGTGSAVPVAIAVRKQANLISAAHEQQRLQEELSVEQARLVKVGAHAETLRKEIARADALRSKRPWSGVLALVAGCMSDAIWLDSLETDPPVGQARPSSTPAVPSTGGDAPQVITLHAPRRLNLKGYALNQEDLYDFIDRLKTANVFAAVNLVQSRSEPLGRASAVRFAVQCDW